MCNLITSLRVLFTIVQLLQFNSSRNHLLHIVKLRKHFKDNRLCSSFVAVALV